MTATVVDPLVARGAALGLLARLLGEHVQPLATGQGIAELRQALEQVGDPEVLEPLVSLEALPLVEAEELSAYQVRIFDHAQVSPYESSYVPTGGQGHMGLLADVAGFYRAFGVHVSGERPDHVVAELEFLSLVTLAEAHHRRSGDAEGVEVCSDAAAMFLRDHVGCWLDAFAARLRKDEPGCPYTPIAETAARLVAGEVRRRGVTIVQPYSPFENDTGATLDEAPFPVCGGTEDGPADACNWCELADVDVDGDGPLT